MFKTGDKVVCINEQSDLKINKIYTILDSNFKILGEEYIELVELSELIYPANKFISLREYRKLKLEKLNV